MEAVTQPTAHGWQRLGAVLRRLFPGVTVRRRERQLHLRETLALGDRRYLAIVECRGKEFLVGCTGSSISLLSTLPAREGPEGKLPGELQAGSSDS